MKIFICGDCCPDGMLACQDTYISDGLRGPLKIFAIRACTHEAFFRYVFLVTFKIPLGKLIVRSSFYVLFYKILKRMR